MKKVRALIVDDSSVMRKIVERSLRQAGIDLSEVLEAANGAEALGALNQGAVDLILCDINMPVMDGIEFLKQLKAVDGAKSVPVVMITTEGNEAHVVQALSAGARSFVSRGSLARSNNSGRAPSISFQSPAVQARSDDQRQFSRPKRLSA